MIFVIGVLYFAILIFLGWLGYRNTKNTTDYLLGGRNTHPFIMALSYGATFISTSAVVGFGGVAANTGLSLMGLVFLNVLVGVFLAFVFFGKRTQVLGAKLDAHTFPELLGKRFDSKFIQAAAGAIIFIVMPIYAAAVLKGGVNFMETYFHIPYEASLLIFTAIVAMYVLVGGFKSVLYTDAFQGTIMFISMLALTAVTYYKLGGIFSAHEQLTALIHEPSIQASIAGQKALGFVGWTALPAAGSPLWWSLISSMFGAMGFGVLAQPQLIMRFMTVKRVRDLNRAVTSGGIFVLVMAGGAYVVGSLCNVLIFDAEGVIAKVAAGGVNDKIIPYYIVNYMPAWFGLLFLFSMLSASMSTLSAQFHTMGTSLGRDVGRNVFPKMAEGIAINRYGIMMGILLSLLLAWLARYLPAGDAIIAKGTIMFFEMALCVFMPVYVGALFSKKMPKLAAEAGVVAGFAVWLVWTLFVSSNATIFKICKILTGKDTLVDGTFAAPIANISTFIVGMLASIIAIAIGWAVSKSKERAKE